MILLLSADFFQNELFQKILSGTLSVSNSLDLDQDQRSVSPDLVQTVLQRSSAEDKICLLPSALSFSVIFLKSPKQTV